MLIVCFTCIFVGVTFSCFIFLACLAHANVSYHPPNIVVANVLNLYEPFRCPLPKQTRRLSVKMCLLCPALLSDEHNINVADAN